MGGHILIAKSPMVVSSSSSLRRLLNPDHYPLCFAKKPSIQKTSPTTRHVTATCIKNPKTIPSISLSNLCHRISYHMSSLCSWSKLNQWDHSRHASMLLAKFIHNCSPQSEDKTPHHCTTRASTSYHCQAVGRLSSPYYDPLHNLNQAGAQPPRHQAPSLDNHQYPATLIFLEPPPIQNAGVDQMLLPLWLQTQRS